MSLSQMESHQGRPRGGHAHFWNRAMSRAQFIQTAAGATGLALSSGLWMPGLELATITDFDGTIGVTDVQGTGKGTNTRTGQTMDLLFDSDMRFMKGTYIGVDGQRRTGTFGFI